MPTSYFCYADESGQDTEGKLFIVAVVLTDADSEPARSFCEVAEKESKKGKTKWSSSKDNFRMDYICRVIRHSVFKGRLFYAIYRDTKRYQNATTQTINRVIKSLPPTSGKVGVYIDALPKALEQSVVAELRRNGSKIEKVRGIAKDENEALIRLADALCGLVRKAVDGDPDSQELLDWGVRAKIIHDITN
jgi:hypothetical protein